MKGKNSQKYISLMSLADRWECSRSSASRIVNRSGMRKVKFGEEKNNAMVRVYLEDVVEFEKTNTTRGICND